MASPNGPPLPVSNPITGTWRNSFADKDKKGRDLQKFDRVEELSCDPAELIGITKRNNIPASYYLLVRSYYLNYNARTVGDTRGSHL
ncbi:hypothetical protein MTP99_003669 [Tenebrio molitor]|jgi:hypothetical protein|nr:hypothetical protein MTP99_003669 [Tenebrio molitor]